MMLNELGRELNSKYFLSGSCQTLLEQSSSSGLAVTRMFFCSCQIRPVPLIIVLKTRLFYFQIKNSWPLKKVRHPEKIGLMQDFFYGSTP